MRPKLLSTIRPNGQKKPMKNKKEQHGEEANTQYLRDGKDYSEWKEPTPQRPTFGDKDHKTTSTGIKHPGHDRNWPGAPPRNGDANENQKPTPISGGKDGHIPNKRRHSTVDAYTGGRDYDPENSRVPDAGKKWTASAPTGDPKMYPNKGPQTPANKREVQIGWKKRYADALRPDVQVADAMTSPTTPQRKKLRKTESKS
jgi:hypothetical protein